MKWSAVAAIVAIVAYASYIFYFKDNPVAGIGAAREIKSEEDKVGVLDNFLGSGGSPGALEEEKGEIIGGLISTTSPPKGRPLFPETQESYDSAAAEKIKLLESLKNK